MKLRKDLERSMRAPDESLWVVQASKERRGAGPSIHTLNAIVWIVVTVIAVIALLAFASSSFL